MRAREFIQEDVTPTKPVTLKALHKIKHEERHQQKVEAQRWALMPIMYGDDDPREAEQDRRDITLDRRELELDKREAELDLLDQHLRQSEKYHDAVQKMAKSGIDATDKTEVRLTKLAHSGLGRKRKATP